MNNTRNNYKEIADPVRNEELKGHQAMTNKPGEN